MRQEREEEEERGRRKRISLTSSTEASKIDLGLCVINSVKTVILSRTSSKSASNFCVSASMSCACESWKLSNSDPE